MRLAYKACRNLLKLLTLIFKVKTSMLALIDWKLFQSCLTLAYYTNNEKMQPTMRRWWQLLVDNCWLTQKIMKGRVWARCGVRGGAGGGVCDVVYWEVWGELRPHWCGSSLLHSKFQSWQMRSLLTLDIWKNTSVDAIQIIETTHETKPKVNNMYRMRHNFMLSTSWIYWNTLWLLSNCFKIIICTHYSFLILLL